ncbi:hypothetical protein DYB37_001051 [Aphanomyces astaci]|uniref:Uncharacterized protein n=1 Tax=Aphanomyces astaci TaxID=112090 RepID=A0A397EJQ3_APHAT|nr:hypothetical protein DYB30_006168 [Aphanomyces astaci]RHY95411.1 hypothetical protein DYB31_000800 [Aphanomyces astaci]RHY97256.1 hypothetical protein DYB35_003344 [Aphanomyces astaci]RHZ24171.1 hypothetical protein DYB37_001051 [Aphanomyces astaci]
MKGGASPSSSPSWTKLVKVVRRIPVFELEEAVLRNTHDVKLRVELGLRYSETFATEMPAMLLLEQASLFSDNAAVGWRFWNTLGDLHFSLLKRYPRYNYCFAFHLQKCTSALAKALSYIENVADTSLIVKYATGLFMKGERELPYELLKSLSLTYASNGAKLEPAAVVERHALLFRVTLANSIMHEAVHHITKLIELVTADTTLLPTGYTLNDFHLMLARCAQIEGDFLFATHTFSRILGETFGHSTVYSDDQYFSLWHHLGTSCYDQGHMWLCIEYYTLALTYAKHLPMRATIYYRRGLAYYCIGEAIKAEDDYRRAKSACHDVKPDVTLHDLKKEYLVEFDRLLDTPVATLISQVRKGMGKTTASIKVQRHFRHFMQRKRKKSDASRLLRRFSNSNRASSVVNLLASTDEGDEPIVAAPVPPGDVSCVQHWKAIIKCGQKLYPTSDAIHRAVAHVKFFHTNMPGDVAFCALADSDGQVDEACGKLSDANYRSELDCICRVLDVSAWMTMHDDGRPVELAGVPEIDPDTGRFFVHALDTSMFKQGKLPSSPEAAITSVHSHATHDHIPIVIPPSKLKLQQTSSVLFEKRILKDKPFRVGHVIERHASSTSDLNAMPESIVVVDPRPPKLLQSIASTNKLKERTRQAPALE